MTEASKELREADKRRAAGAAGLLTSDYPGEVVAAARSLCGLLAKGGLDPASVVARGLSSVPVSRLSPMPAGARPDPVRAGSPWQRRAMMARGCPDLTAWEGEFLASIVELRSLSPKQQDRLNAILAKSDRCRP